MMMTRSYYGAEHDSFSRPSYRLPASTSQQERQWYDRTGPYSQAYYDIPRPQMRSEYDVRPEVRTLIHDQAGDAVPGHARRRIQVACSRCRRRKIKCTGDPGDGSGCSACRSAGAEKSSCTFNRVGSHSVTVAGVDTLPVSSTIATAAVPATSYGVEASTSAYSSILSQQSSHRPSLPMLHTRGYPEYASYDTSPVDEYTYASSAVPCPRQSSFSSNNYNTENFRPYTTGPAAASTATANAYYEPGTAFSFGSLQHAPGFPPSTSLSRLPSVTSETFSALNMSSLQSSLPTQTVQERRLPIPHTQQQPPYATAEVPQIRPLSSLTEPQPRAHLGGVYSRNGMSWSSASPAVSRATATGRHGAMVPPHGLPTSSAGSEFTPMGPPILGYQFSASGSPETSPTTVSAVPENFSNSETSVATSMLPPSSTSRYTMGNSGNGLPAARGAEEYRRPSSSYESAATLYSVSSGAEEASGRSTPARHMSQASTESSPPAGHHQSYTPLRHPQPQHAASLDELRRRSSFDQHRSTTAHRMSVSNLNAHY